MIAQTNWENVIIALIAGIPAMLAAITTLIITLRGQSQIKQTVVEEGKKTALVAQSVREKTEQTANEVKATLQEATFKRELVAQDQANKLDNLIKTTDTVKTTVNGHLTEILKTSTDALTKAVELNTKSPQQAIPMLPQEVKISSDSEISIKDSH